MRRNYLFVVMLLLALGVVSTFALAGLGQQTIAESVTTEYIIKYTGTAEIVSTTTTSSNTNTHVELYIEIIQSSAQPVKFEITPCSDTEGQDEITSTGNGDYTVKIVYEGSEDDTTVSATDVPNGEGLGFTITSAVTSDKIDYIVVDWYDAYFYSRYWSANIIVEDL